METNAEERLNHFMVHVFNQILSWEGKTLKKTGVENLTIRELHAIEAVSNLSQNGTNTMANIARFLSITPGALTTNINALVNKGYVERCYTPKDRRIVYVKPTELGTRINEIHEKFHERMVGHMIDCLNENELSVLLDSLDKLSDFFQSKMD